MSKPKRVLILGGGPAALTTAWHLSHDPQCAGKYDITVLQMGWRLGGKGASGRERAEQDRVLEHGLHIMFGFYQNFFKMITETYTALNRPAGSPLATWEQAFLPGYSGCAMDQWKEQWLPVVLSLPGNTAVPGQGEALNDTKSYLGALVAVGIELAFGWKTLEELDVKLYGQGGTVGKLPPDPSTGAPDTLVRWAMAVLEDILLMAKDISEYLEKKTEILAILDELNTFAHRFESYLSGKSHKAAIAVAGIDFLVALLRGILADGVLLENGYTAIDDDDFADWLVKHGMDPVNRASIGVRFIYDAAFCFQNGDAEDPRLSAGVAVRTLLRMGLSYKGAAFYKLAAGMGDTIIAPIYLVLKQKGVKFGFFQMVDAVIPHPKESRIEAVQVRLQAKLKSADPFAYDPLFDCKGLPCWPAEPDWEQIDNAEQLKHISLESYYSEWPEDHFKTYVYGKDFDHVVLATPIKCLPFIAPELIQRSQRWRAMVDKTAAVPTMALQAWFDKDIRELGWKGPDSPLLSLYVDPLNTWSDMTMVLEHENWSTGNIPRSLAYFCGPQLGGASPPPRSEGAAWIKTMEATAQQAGEDFLASYVGGLFPDSLTSTGDFNWNLLSDPKNRIGQARFAAQYTRSNAEPQEWCTLSLPNTNQFRLKAGDTDFDNLSLSGDWIDNGFYIACLEGAILGGIYAARAVSGVDIPIIGETLDRGLGKPPRPCALDRFPPEQKVKIAILGSGVGSMAAAWALAHAPEAHRMQITVYQYGWRLGGKGASGRNLEEHDRIEEHGLHIWGGMYENAFEMIQQAYVAIQRPSNAPMSCWYDPKDKAKSAFWPHHEVSISDDFAEVWHFWNLILPANESLPGDGQLLDDPTDYLQMMASLVVGLLGGGAREATQLPPAPAPEGLLDRIKARLEHKMEVLEPMFTTRLREALVHTLGELSEVGPLLTLLLELRQKLAPLLERMAGTRDHLRWLLEGVDLAVSLLVGVMADDVLIKGFDTVDHEEFIGWLRRHGASEITLEGLLVRGWHDFFFACLNGDPERLSLSAATALRTIFRYVFTYKGAFFWKMQAGMGDTIFAPLYEALVQKGVRFEFFHRVSDISCIGPDGPGDQVERIQVQRQLRLADGVEQYYPLINIKGVPSYPSAPLWEQIDPSDAQNYLPEPHRLESAWGNIEPVETIELQRGRDFDLVVLGLSSKPIATVAPSLIARSKVLKDIAEMPTNQTIAAQLWLKPTVPQMGWTAGDTVGTGFVDPHNTWADMGYLLEKESWGDTQPGSLIYLCGIYTDAVPIPPFIDSTFPKANSQRVWNLTRDWLQNNWGTLYPKATLSNGRELDWEKLVAPDSLQGEQRLNAQFWRGNIDPSERYVLSPPGTAATRRRANELGFQNLFGAGDWLYTGLNAGCVEAAAMGGLQAAQAICGSPKRIIGDDNKVFGRKGLTGALLGETTP